MFQTQKKITQDAFLSYELAKEKEALRWAKRLENKEFIVDWRVISALKNWRVYE